MNLEIENILIAQDRQNPAVNPLRQIPLKTYFRSLWQLAVLWPILGVATLSAAQTWESGPNQVHLLELYTSEGCSSCPPAEERLSHLSENPDLWKTFVPVAFHVDYWDNLGWPDAFANSGFTDRQYAYASRWGNPSVYTPGLVVDGHEVRSGFISSEALDGQTASLGNLKILIGAQTVTAHFVPQQKLNSKLRLQIALLGCGIQSVVKRGENSGRTLQHDFIVLSLQSSPLTPSADGSNYTSTTPVPKTSLDCRQALVAWVEDPSTLEPLQAVGGWLKPM